MILIVFPSSRVKKIISNFMVEMIKGTMNPLIIQQTQNRFV